MDIGTTYSMPIGGVGSTTGAAVHSGAKSNTSRTTAFTAFNATARAGLPTPTSVTSQSCGTEVKKDKTEIEDIQILDTEGHIIKAPSEFESVTTVELKGFRPSFSTTRAAGYPGAASSAPRSNTNDWSSSLQTKIPISISPNQANHLVGFLPRDTGEAALSEQAGQLTTRDKTYVAAFRHPYELTVTAGAL